MRNLVMGYTLYSDLNLYDSQGKHSLDLGARLELCLSGEKYCVGSSHPTEGKKVCPNQALAVQGSHCLDCWNDSHLQSCLRCTGRSCNNPLRRSDCVPVRHCVYLAIYGENSFKVGVSRLDRYDSVLDPYLLLGGEDEIIEGDLSNNLLWRIREQGALGAIMIAQEGGQEVRRIEHMISQAGWPDRLDLMQYFAGHSLEREKAHQLLLGELGKIKYRVKDVHWLSDPPLVWCAHNYPAPLPHKPRLINPQKQVIGGTVVGTRGNYLFLEEEGETFIISLRSLVGREIMGSSAEDQGLQLSLAL